MGFTAKELEILAANAAEGIEDLETSTGAKANLASPEFTGEPTAPTPSPSDDSTRIATTEYVQSEIAGMGGGSGLSAAKVGARAALGI